ncbi:unnamed protein product [Closterium sp. NIES-54]
MLCSDRGGEFPGKEFTIFVDRKGIVHDLTCSYTPQRNGIAEREMRTVVESVRTMLLHMGPWRGGKLSPKARWGLHLSVLPKSKGWEVLDLTDNKVVTSVEVIFYETLSLEVWKVKYGLPSGRTQAHLPTDTSTTTFSLLAKVDGPGDEDVEEVQLSPPFYVPASLPLVVNPPSPTHSSATGDEGSLEVSHVAPASDIAGGRRDTKLVDEGMQRSTTQGRQTGEVVEKLAAAKALPTGEQQTRKSTGKSASGPTKGEQPVEGQTLAKKLVDDEDVDDEGELTTGEDSIDSDVVEVPVEKPELRRSCRSRKPPERLSFHACLPPATFNTLLDDAEADVDLPTLDPDVHTDPDHRWDIVTMTSWNGKAVEAAMDEENRSLIGMGMWELVERPRGVNIMKNRWVLMTKYHIDDTVVREKARLVVKGFIRSGGSGSSGSRCAAVRFGVSGGGLAQLQRRPRVTLMPQVLREWYAQRGASRSSARCPYVIRTGARAGQTYGTRAEFGAAAELPRWLELLKQGVDIFALDYGAILTAMYALPIGTKGDCSLCVLPDPSIEAAALGASESALPGTAP